MPLVRHVVAALVAGSLLWSVPLGAQDSTGAVTGQVVDGTTQQPLANVEVAIAGTPHRMLSRNDGSFVISGLPAGIYRVRATRITKLPSLRLDRKSTRLNSSHLVISYAVFCLK